MTRRNQPDPISNQYFTVLDGANHQYRVCRHWGRVLMIGWRRRRLKTGKYDREVLLEPGSHRYRYVLRIAKGLPYLPRKSGARNPT